ncbi:MAG: AzlD domain-containing protein [Anaerolineaceae bacterium]|nr:AzlD domain-containing protein [Anaerolineaceae bacterium]
MSNIWVVMLSVGVLTFLTRLSFIYLLDKWQPPEMVTSALRFVPVAVLTAIFIPEIALQNGELALSFENIRLLAGIIAILVAWRTKSALWTIGIGMISFWALTWLM